MAGVDYRYELWRADEVIATGHLNRESRRARVAEAPPTRGLRV